MARNVFLSFVAEDLDLVWAFRGQAKIERNDLEFSDYSVKEPFDSYGAEYIKSQIRPLIRGCSVTVCLIGYKTHTSPWVDWELRESIAQGNGLVGMRLHSSWLDIAPQSLAASGAQVVDWNIPSIVAAIESAARRAGY